MKKITKAVYLLLCFALLFCGCSTNGNHNGNTGNGGEDESQTGGGNQEQPGGDHTGEGEHTHNFVLTIISQPDKTSYEEGTSFDGEGMELALVCECEHNEAVTEYEVVYENGGNAFALQDTSVTIVSGGKQVKITITIKAYGGGTWSEPMPFD